MLEFPHITGPVVGIENIQNFRVYVYNILKEFPVKIQYEAFGQKRYIFHAFPQRRNVQVNHSQTVK